MQGQSDMPSFLGRLRTSKQVSQYSSAHCVCSSEQSFLAAHQFPQSPMGGGMTFEPHHKNISFWHMQKQKAQISCAVTAQLIRAFVFAPLIVQSFFFLNPKFQAFSYLPWLYSLVCVRLGRKPQRQISSRRGTFSDLPHGTLTIIQSCSAYLCIT